MSILDDAIREHLELKRAHGADDEELKRLEDEAFGPPQRPDEADPFAEAPTEFLTAPGDGPSEAPELGDPDARSGRRPDIADLQEAPPPAPETDEADLGEIAPPAPEDELSPSPDAPPPSPEDAAAAPPPPPIDAGPNTEERHAIADQPTQMFDVEAEIGAPGEALAVEPDVEAPAAEPSPTDEELVDAVQDEPRAAPPAPEQPPLATRGPDAEVAGHPPAEAAPEEEESAEFDFFNEQRLSDELDQALEAPITDERALPGYGEGDAQGGVFDYEDDPSEEALRRHDASEPPSEETPRDTYEPPSEETERPADEEPDSEEHDMDYDPETGHDDVLEDTPRFLEDQPEDDDLWFEQRPPKDFDLD